MQVSPRRPIARHRARVPIAISLLMVCLAGVEALAGERPDAGASAKRDATAMYQAFMRGDLDTYAKYTYPGLLKLIGGKAKMLAMLRKGTTGMRRQGITFQSVAVYQASQMVSAAGELQALLPMEVVLDSPKGELRTRSHLLGVSRDQGRHWTFIDTAKLNRGNIKRVLPTYNPALVLPRGPEFDHHRR